MSARFALFAALCALAQGVLAAPPQDAAEGGDSRAADAFTKPVERCYGGAEDGKTVVRNADLTDDAAQTTLAGCRLSGGAVARAPRSPAISAGWPVVA